MKDYNGRLSKTDDLSAEEKEQLLIECCEKIQKALYSNDKLFADIPEELKYTIDVATSKYPLYLKLFKKTK